MYPVSSFRTASLLARPEPVSPPSAGFDRALNNQARFQATFGYPPLRGGFTFGNVATAQNSLDQRIHNAVRPSMLSFATAENSIGHRMNESTPSFALSDVPASPAPELRGADYSHLETDMTYYTPAEKAVPDYLNIAPADVGLARSAVSENALPQIPEQLSMRNRYRDGAKSNANLKLDLWRESTQMEAANPAFTKANAALQDDVLRLQENGKLTGTDGFAHELEALHDSVHNLSSNHDAQAHPSTVLRTLLEERGLNPDNKALSEAGINNLVMDYMAYRSLKSSLS